MIDRRIIHLPKRTLSEKYWFAVDQPKDKTAGRLKIADLVSYIASTIDISSTVIFNLSHATTDYDKFVTYDSTGKHLYYRTGAEIITDLELDTRYLKLSGIAGGQYARGGTAVTDKLQFAATAGIGAAGANIEFLYGTDGDSRAGYFDYQGNLILDKNQYLDDTTSANIEGVVYKGTDLWMHNYHEIGGAHGDSWGDNTFLGINAGNLTLGTVDFDYEGSANTGIGKDVLSSLTKGWANTAVGRHSQRDVTSGTENTSIGRGSLIALTTGILNTALGKDSLYKLIDGDRNIGIGHNAFYSLVSGIKNIAIGNYTGYYALGDSNIYIGHYSVDGTGVNGDFNIVIGDNINLMSNTGSNQLNIGGVIELRSVNNSTPFIHDYVPSAGSTQTNVFIGYSSGSTSISAGVSYEGSKNVAIGYNTMNAATTAWSNTAIGTQVMQAITTGYNNAGVGHGALISLTEGFGNLAFGRNALNKLTTGDDNIGFGKDAGYNLISGSYNTLIGNDAAENLTSGSSNIIFGRSAALTLTTGTFNIIIGASVNVSSASSSYELSIGDSIKIKTYNDSPFLHDYIPVSGAGENTFGGHFSGNESMNSTGPSYEASANTGFGYYALNSITTGWANTAMGRKALSDLTTGTQNTGIGRDALRYLTTGDLNVAVGKDAMHSLLSGDENIGIGHNAWFSSTTGYNNVGIGENVGYLSTGYSNVFIGHHAGYKHTGNESILIGDNAGSLQTSGDNIIIIGHNLQTNNYTSSNWMNIGATIKLRAINLSPFIHDYKGATGDGQNTFIGYYSGNETLNGTSSITGTSNTGVGWYSLNSLTTGRGNTAMGWEAMKDATTAAQNSAFGRGVMQSLTTGEDNHGFGKDTLYSLTTGLQNVGVGHNSLYSNVSGNYSVAIGKDAGYYMTANSGIFIGRMSGFYQVGAQNTYIGEKSGYGTSGQANDGIRNVYIGHEAGWKHYTGSGNLMFGYQAGYNSTTAAYNLFMGYKSGNVVTTGAHNVFLGFETGYTTTTGSRNILFGYGIDAPLATTDDYLNIGNTIKGLLDSGNISIGVEPHALYKVYVIQDSTTNNTAANYFRHTGVVSGTAYAVRGSSLGSGGTLNIGGDFSAYDGVTNYGIKVTASGGTNNYAIYSSVGDNYFAGTVQMNSVAAAGGDTGKYMVLDGNEVEYLTLAEMQTAIGASQWTDSTYGIEYEAGNVGVGIDANTLHKFRAYQNSTTDQTTGIHSYHVGVVTGTKYAIRASAYSGTSTTAIGLHVSAYNATNNYAIYSAGGDNYFEDQVQINTFGVLAGNFITHSGGVLQERTASQVVGDLGTALDATYLKLDASNDPVTGTLSLSAARPLTFSLGAGSFDQATTYVELDIVTGKTGYLSYNNTSVLFWDGTGLGLGTAHLGTSAGNFLTLSGGYVQQRTAAQTIIDLGIATDYLKLDCSNDPLAGDLAITGSGTSNLYALHLTNTGAGEGLRISTADVTGNNGIYWNQGSTSMFNLYSHSTNNVRLAIGSNIFFTTNGASYFNSGNVLIGTTTDSGYKLDVQGTSYFDDLLTIETGIAPFKAIEIESYATSSYNLNMGVVDNTDIYIGTGYYYNSSLYQTKSTYSTIIKFEAGIFKIFTDSGLTALTNFSPSERMRITTGGQVNINNTTNTTYQFYVDGTGYFSDMLEVNSAIQLSGTGSGAGGRMYLSAANGVVHYIGDAAAGTVNDWLLYSGSTSNIMAVPTGTLNVNFYGNLNIATGKTYQIGAANILATVFAATPSTTLGATQDAIKTYGDANWAAMVYPGAGIAVSIGSAWGTSITDNSTNWNTAYTHSQLISGNPHSVTASDVGLGSVENTALSTWAGSANITTLGTIVTGVWNGTVIPINKGGTGVTSDINTAGTLSNVAYLDQSNVFDRNQTINNASAVTSLIVTNTAPTTITYGISSTTASGTVTNAAFRGNASGGVTTNLAFWAETGESLFEDIITATLTANDASAYPLVLQNLGTAGTSHSVGIEFEGTSSVVGAKVEMTFASSTTAGLAFSTLHSGTLYERLRIESDGDLRIKYSDGSDTPDTGYGYLRAKSATSLVWVAAGTGTEQELIGSGSGTVTSVDMSVPTGLAISGNPITTSGTLALTYASGYSIPTDSSQTSWDGKQDALTFGIAFDSVSKIVSASVGSGEYARFTASGLEGRTTAEVLADLVTVGNTAFNKDFGTSGTTVAYGNHVHSGVYEPAFSKNTAFNKNFAGTGSATTPSRSDHTHSIYAPLGSVSYHTEAISIVNATLGNTCLYIRPHASQVGDMLTIRNKANTADVFAVYPSELVALRYGTSINEFSIDGTLAGDSDDALPTEKAVKTYVDAQVGFSVGDAHTWTADQLYSDGTKVKFGSGADVRMFWDNTPSNFVIEADYDSGVQDVIVINTTVANSYIRFNYPDSSATAIDITEGDIMMFGLPTSDSGLAIGTIWRDGTTLKIVIA